MSRRTHVRASAPPFERARGLIRWVGTSNPFYVLSAALFLAGLWMSFRAQDGDVETWSLTLGLSGYTLLLAVTGCLLVRFGNVWDDVRTVLLLVVLMFLATSATYDEVLVLQPARGIICCLGGFLFAVAVSEGILRGSGLALRPLLRVPYYLILALFYLYPLALRPFAQEPHSAAMMWGLFCFSTIAGLIFLTLLPAIRREPDYVRGNGSPWRWPLYPWVLFGLLAAAVPVRSFLLCWTMHLLAGRDGERLIFGAFFVIPFGLAIAVLLLEMGQTSGKGSVIWAALSLPAVLVELAMTGHRADPVYQEFQQMFRSTLGGDPLYITMLAVIGFYAYAALRRVGPAVELLIGALLALAAIGPDSLRQGPLAWPQPIPLLLAAGLQTALGLWRRQSARYALGLCGLVFVAALLLPDPSMRMRTLITFHLALAAMLFVGAEFDDRLARTLRLAALAMMLVASLAAMFDVASGLAGMPPWLMDAYPLALALVAGIYGWLLCHRPAIAVCIVVVSCWLVGLGWWCYHALREAVTGLDYIAVSLALFGLAILVSLAKSGLLARFLTVWPGLPRQAAIEEGEL